jgi:hypothetical protein
MDYDKLLKQYEQMKKTAEKYQSKYRSFREGYEKTKKKLAENNKQKQQLKEEIIHIQKNHNDEINKYKVTIQKYKKTGLDFATKKKVLELQQTLNAQEENVFKLREKLKEKQKIIGQHEIDTKQIKDENIILKNLLNNIQTQILNVLPKSETSSNTDELIKEDLQEVSEDIENISVKSENKIQEEENSDSYVDTDSESDNSDIAEEQDDISVTYNSESEEVDINFN